jgi:hypothetical protein
MEMGADWLLADMLKLQSISKLCRSLGYTLVIERARVGEQTWL